MTTSRAPSRTRMRLAQNPGLAGIPIFEAIAPVLQAKIGALETINGASPPNQRDFLDRRTACSVSNLPTSVEPVKLSSRSIGSGPVRRRFLARPCSCSK
jgi:hypothetical protein